MTRRPAGKRGGVTGPPSPDGDDRKVIPFRSRGSGKTFDSWLSRQLRDMYDSVIDEPLPDDLAALIRRHREAEAPPAEAAPPGEKDGE